MLEFKISSNFCIKIFLLKSNTDWIFDAVNSKAVENLSPLISQNPPQNYPEGWHHSLLHLQEINNQVYGLPFHDGPECLIFRKDLFENKTEYLEVARTGRGTTDRVTKTDKEVVWEVYEKVTGRKRPA